MQALSFKGTMTWHLRSVGGDQREVSMYLAHRSGGWPMQDLLWKFVSASVLLLHDLGASETERMRALMEQYRDTPMDRADASLVAVAERLDQTRIFTLDHHFRVYRLKGIKPFQTVPA